MFHLFRNALMTTRSKPSIDTSLLQRKKIRGDKLEAQCPACAAAGADNTGNHFFLNQSSGKFGCVANEGDHQHRQEIFALVGIKEERREFTAKERREYGRSKRKEKKAEEARQALSEQAQKGVLVIRRKYAWSLSDVFYGSPIKLDDPLVIHDPRYLIKTLFKPSDTVWTGETWQSAEHGHNRFRTALQWQQADVGEVGPMTAPATWKENIINRNGENFTSSPFHVLDFDELDGKKPTTEAEKAALVAHALAATNFLVKKHNAKLAAIVHTGNKSLHVWIESESINAEELQNVREILGIDKGLIGHPHHPCRLSGQIHEKSGETSRVLWLRENTW